jgi:hypothetical protein
MYLRSSMHFYGHFNLMKSLRLQNIRIHRKILSVSIKNSCAKENKDPVFFVRCKGTYVLLMFNYQRLQIALYLCHSSRFLEYSIHLIKLIRFLYLYKSKIKVVHKK